MTATASQQQLTQLLADLAAERQQTAALQQTVQSLRHDLHLLQSGLGQVSAAPSATPEEPTPANRATQERARQAVQAAGLVVWEWDLVGNSVYLDASWGNVTGESAPEGWWPSGELLKLVHPEDLPTLDAAIKAVRQNHQNSYAVEHRVRTAAGWVWIESIGAVTGHNSRGQPLRMTGVNRDITGRRPTHGRGDQATKNSPRGRAVLQQQTLLQLRQAFADSLQQVRLLQSGPLDSQQQTRSQTLAEGAQTALQLMDQLDLLTRIEDGQLTLDRSPFQLEALVKSAVAAQAERARAQGLQCSISVAAGLPPTVIGDAAQLSRMLERAMARAVQDTQRGGIAVSVRPAPQQTEAGPGQVRLLLEIRDSGAGLSEQAQQLLLDPHAVASGDHRDLGMPLAARLATLMEGDMNIASRDGRGTAVRFTVNLGVPSSTSASASRPAAATRAPASGQAPKLELRGLRVLLAENNPVNEIVTRRLLDMAGCRTMVVQRGDDALHQWQIGGIDLVLLNGPLPGMNGPDVTARMRTLESPRGGHTPIVGMGGSPADRARLMASGMDSYVNHPVTPTTLHDAMRLALAKGKKPVEELLSSLHIESMHVLDEPEGLDTVPPSLPANMLSDFLPTQPHEDDDDEDDLGPRTMPPSLLDHVRDRSDDAGGDASASAHAPLDIDADAVARAIDQEGIRIRFGHAGARREFVRASRKDLKDQLGRLRLAGDTRNTATARASVHALRGTLATLGAVLAGDVARELESAARQNNWALFAATLPHFSQALAQVDKALDQASE